MIIRKAYKFRIKANSEIDELLFQFSGCNRKVWNMALALQKDSLDKTGKVLSYNHLAGCLVEWKKNEDTSFLQTAPSQTLQQTLKFLDRAVKDAFDKKQPRKRFPVWKKKFKCVDSFRYPQGFKIETGFFCLRSVGFGSIRAGRSREAQGT